LTRPLDFESFAVERAEFDSFYAYAASETPEMIKRNYASTLYLPSHAPALMKTIVVGDRLLVITGNRNWKTGENETLVYRLPDLEYEGSFFLPFSNGQNIKWSDPYYISVDRLERDEDYLWRYAIYKIEEASGVRAK
jgi:hypothetical protein